MSDTPMTDAVLDKGKREPITSRAFSLADHARRLERELAEANDKLSAIDREWQKLYSAIKHAPAEQEAGEVGPWWCCRADFGEHEETCKNHPNNRREAGEVNHGN